MLARLRQFWRGRGRLGRVGAVAALLTVVSVFVAPAPALADDWFYYCTDPAVSCQNGVVVDGPPSGLPCGTSPEIYGSTKVCVKYDGDYVYVRDGIADGHAAVAVVDSDSGSVRLRFCRNPGVKGSWARCNFDWVESGYKYVSGGFRLDTYDISGYGLMDFANN